MNNMTNHYEKARKETKEKMDKSFAEFVSSLLAELKNTLGDKKVLCALSGGVDSAIVASLIHAVNPKGLTCVFVDHGLMRKGEVEEVMRVFKEERGMNVIKVDAAERFLKKLHKESDPEKKRKIIGTEFIRVFEEEAKNIGKVQFLAQGTIYPDILESIHGVKSHHNLALPDVVDFDELVEPLKLLFKDEVRKVGKELGLPDSIIMRQPFPGPGLSVRCLGAITKERLEILREADYIYRSEIALNGLDKEIWQYFTVLPQFTSVGVLDNKRTEGHSIVLRAVTSKDAMQASVYPIPFELLQTIANKITSALPSVNRVLYDLTNKPPATIEWE